MKKIKLLFLAILISGSAIAQKAILKGKIVDDQGMPLPGASISINDKKIITASNAVGEFFLNNIEAGNYAITVEYIGFKTLSKEMQIEAGQTSSISFEMEPGIELSEVIINSRLIGDAKAINSQKNAVNITNMISYEQLERFPDANIGDALKRLTGINVQLDQGEARFGNIRGTSPELSSITINGERIPSAEGEIRVVQLDLVPSDLIHAIEFNKAVTADMDADAIGGSINLVTKSAPYKQEIKGKIGSGWNFISNKPSIKGSLIYSNRLFKDKLGLVVSASAYDNMLGSDDIEAEWDYSDENNKDASAFTTEFQNRQYYIERLRQSYSMSVDYKFSDNHLIYIKGIYNWRNDWENRHRLSYKDIENNGDGTYTTEMVRQLKFGVADNKYARLEDQRMMSFSGGGEHLFGKLKIDWSGAFSKANEERPNERYMAYAVSDVIVNLDLANKETPFISFPSDADQYRNLTGAYELDELTEEYQYTEEVDKNFKINFEIPLNTGYYANKFKFGFRYRGKSKMRDNYLYEYSPVDEDAFNTLVLSHLTDVSKDNFFPGDYQLGSFPNPNISDYFNLEDDSQFEKEEDISQNAGDFDAKENILASYAMFTQNIGNKITVLAGLRAEQTRLEYQGRIFDIPSEEEEDLGAEPSISNTAWIKDDYLNILPSVHLKYSPNETSNFRFAWTNTISRPNYYDIVPYQEINRDDNEILFGNPELTPTSSMNFDLLYEKFYKNIGYFSAGVFYKELKDIIAWEFQSDYTFNGTVYSDYRKPENIADASLIGFETAFNRRLDFLPSFLKNLTFYANYTFVQSELKNIVFEGREDEKLPLAGSPKHSYNISLAYDTKKLDLRLSFNHTSAFLNVNDDGGFGEESFFDYYYDKVNNLDFNMNYQFTKYFHVFFDANNLLNQPLRTYSGISERTIQAEYYGIKFNLGLGFKF